MSILHKIISYHNKSPKDSTAHDFSSYIVNHLSEISDLSIDELAEKSNASAATINRQVRAICGMTYKQFQKDISRDLKHYPNENHCFNFYNRYSRDKSGYIDCLTDCLAKLKESCSNETLKNICKEMHLHKSICVYLPFAHSSSKSQLQMDLMVSGKQTTFLSHFDEWAEDVKTVDKNTLLIVSNSSQPNEFYYTELVDLLEKAKGKGAFIVSINAYGRPDIEKYSDLSIGFEDTRTAMNVLLVDVIFNLIKVIYREEYMLF